MRKEKKLLDNVINTIKSATELSLDNAKVIGKSDAIIEDLFSSINPKNKIFVQIMNETVNTFKALQVSL